MRMSTVSLLLSLLFCFLLTDFVRAKEELKVQKENCIIVKKLVNQNDFNNGSLGSSEDEEAEQGVAEKFLITDDRKRFELVRESRITLPQDNKVVSSDHLQVPCRVVINYQKVSQSRSNVVHIEVIEVLSGASSQWEVNEPL